MADFRPRSVWLGRTHFAVRVVHLMFFGTKKGLATTCLIGVTPLIAAAWFFEAPGLIFPLAVVALAAIGFLFSGGDSRHPDLRDTERFLVSLLAQRGYSGAFQLTHIRHRTADGPRKTIAVHFRAVATITEPLYVTRLPPPEVCGHYTPRRLASVCTLAQRLEVELGARARLIVMRAPPDLYSRQYIAAQSRQGWHFEFTGLAYARLTSSAGWAFNLSQVSREIQVLEHTGRPRAAFPGAIVLDASDGQQWLSDTLQAWQLYEAEIASMQGLLQDTRSARGAEAIAAFFASIPVGSIFQGTAETLTGQLSPMPVELTITAIDPENNDVHLTLGHAERKALVRHFRATASHDALENAVHLTAQTRAEDALRDGGPLLDAATAFEIDFRWDPDAQPPLHGTGGDFLLRLTGESPQVGSSPSDTSVHDREIWNALAPATSYAGTIEEPDGERRLRLVFMPAPDLNGVAARVEWEGSTGLFNVVRFPARGDGYDLKLEPTAVPATAGRAPAESRGLHRLLLRVENTALKGVAEGPNGPRRVQLAR